MSCNYPDAPNREISTALGSQGLSSSGLDLTPYLNFLLDIDNPDSPLPTPLSACQRQPAVGISLSETSTLSNKSKTVSSFAKDINVRLDRLESELSKIVNSVTGRKCSKSESSTSSSTDAEPVQKPQTCTSRARSFLRKKTESTSGGRSACQGQCPNDTYRASTSREKQSKVRLIPPECFESRRSVGDPPRKKHSPYCDSKEGDRRLTGQAANSTDVCTRPDADLDESRREIGKLRNELNSCREARDNMKHRAEQLETQLGEECMEKRKLQRKLDENAGVMSQLTSKLEAQQQKEQEFRNASFQKAREQDTVQHLQQENSCLREELQRLNKLSRCRTASGSRDTDKQHQLNATRQAVDEALKRATAKFCRFHTDEMRSLEAKFRSEQNKCQENKSQQTMVITDDTEIQLLKRDFGQTQRELAAARASEECARNKSFELEYRVKRSDEMNQQKHAEIDELRSSIKILQKECERIPHLKETIAVLHAEKCCLTSYKDTVEILEKKVKALQNEKDQLQTDLEERKREKVSLCAQLNGFDKDSRCQKEQDHILLRMREDEVEKQKTEIKSLSETIKIKDKILDDLQDTVMKLRKTFDTPPKVTSNQADMEHLKRRNRELEDVLERLEQRKNDLKEQLLTAECQLQDSMKAHHIINTKLKERATCINKLQATLEAHQARAEIREEELQRDCDEARRKAEALQNKLEDMVSRSREQRLTEFNRLKSKYENQSAQKDSALLQYEQEISNLENKLQAVQCALSIQKKPMHSKCNRLERSLPDFDCDV